MQSGEKPRLRRIRDGPRWRTVQSVVTMTLPCSKWARFRWPVVDPAMRRSFRPSSVLPSCAGGPAARTAADIAARDGGTTFHRRGMIALSGGGRCRSRRGWEAGHDGLWQRCYEEEYAARREPRSRLRPVRLLGGHLATVDLLVADAQDAPCRSTARCGDLHLRSRAEREVDEDRAANSASIRSVAHQSHVVSPQRPRPNRTKHTMLPGGGYSDRAERSTDRARDYGPFGHRFGRGRGDSRVVRGCTRVGPHRLPGGP
jgi:hypothetical protein